MLTLAATLLVLAQKPSPTQAFADYLARPEPRASWSVASRAETRTDIDLVSQTWQGIDWKHKVVILQPPRVDAKNLGILYITGGDPTEREIAQLRLIAGTTGMPVAVLFNIPNQPLWEMKEDDLIAHTFERFLETGDATWPLLFPMAKSAIKAMDAVADVTKDSPNPLRRFVVTGASKRGWTTWFVGASGDRRVAGIAPMVIDNLNVIDQMPHQIASWGEYSEMIQDYTRRGLQARLETEEGRRLGLMVDPYTYRDRIRVPTLIVNGANDPYWTVDALSLYWDGLRQPKWASIVPNAGHDLGNKIQAIESIGAFARSIAGDFRMPRTNWTVAPDAITFRVEGDGLERLTVWMATSDTLDFRKSEWRRVSSEPVPSQRPQRQGIRVAYPKPADQNVAVMGEMRFRIGARSFSLSTPVRVFKK